MIRLICTDLSNLKSSDQEALYQAASPERKRRADRYLRREDSLRCLAAEALLRYALGADRFAIETGPFGKPRLPEYPDFHFNLSHSGNWVVIACGPTPVGVDVQQHRPDTDWISISRRFFSPEEQLMLRQAEDPCRSFHDIWTGKESYIKYTGTGLTQDLRSFSIDKLEEGLHLYFPGLAGGYSLCLCTLESAYTLELLDGQRLR